MAYSIVGRFFTNTGVPVNPPPAGYRLPDVAIDITTHRVYEWKNSVWTEKPDFFGVGNKGITSCLINANGDLVINFTDNTSQNVGKVVGSNGQDGDDGATPILQSGSTTTLPPGSGATSMIRSLGSNFYAIDFGVPKGEKGDKGDPGTGSQKFNYYTPDQFGTGASAMQTCLNAACNDGLPIYSSGTYNCGTTVLTLPKQFNSLTWYGGRSKIICGGITRPRPANLSESQQQQNTKYNLYDIQIVGNGTGIGFEPAASSNSLFQNLSVESFTTAAIFRTTQHSQVNMLTMNNCINGFSYECETFNPSQSQSNDNKVFQPRFHSNLACGYTVKIQGSFGFQCWGLESEGNGTILNVIDFDDLGNNTVKSCRFYEPHFEHTGGIRSGGAFAKIKLNQGVFLISDANHDVGPLSNMVLVDASACGLNAEIILEDINKWEHSGTIFKGNQCRWNFKRGAATVPFSSGNNPTVQQNIKNLFSAPIPAYAPDNFVVDPKVWGSNTFNWEMF